MSDEQEKMMEAALTQRQQDFAQVMDEAAIPMDMIQVCCMLGTCAFYLRACADEETYMGLCRSAWSDSQVLEGGGG